MQGAVSVVTNSTACDTDVPYDFHCSILQCNFTGYVYAQ